MVNHRIHSQSLSGAALENPFDDGTFDYVVAIGCLHHAGDLKRAIAGCHRVLRPGGKLVMMVNYAYSYSRFVQVTQITIGYFFREIFGYRGIIGDIAAGERAA